MNARGMKRLQEALPNDPLAITTATFQATIDYHERILLLSLSTGIALKLPRANGSGTWLQIVVGVVCTTSPYYVISTNPSTDIFAGSAYIGIDASATAKSFMTVAGGSASNTITVNGTTTGGVTIGDQIFLVDIKAGVWAVETSMIGSGTIATPFSRV